MREDRVGHAYLFSGPRGTGKTSTARILAKALNCTALVDGEPCGVCDSCTSIEAGTSYDLQELDAASNNGVDAMRDLIGKAALGSPGRTKVYILDEVHMLSTGASNALLKTLEEPPAHVVFVLATTDPHKVLPTIRSRTQHFELHLLPADELETLVHEVVADADLQVDDAAIAYALNAGGGSRDTLSALDQVVAAGGVLDRGDQVDDVVDALAAQDTGAALRAVSEAVRRGHDPRVVGEALLAKLRDVFLHRMGDPLVQLPDTARERVVRWSEDFSDRACTRALEAVGEALREMRQATDARIPLEVALVRLTRSEANASLEALADRVDRLERGAPTSASNGAVAEATRPATPEPRVTDREATPPAKADEASPPAEATTSAGGRPLDAARAFLADKAGVRVPDVDPAHAAPVAAAPPPPPPTTPAPPRSAATAPPTPDVSPDPEPANAAEPPPAPPAEQPSHPTADADDRRSAAAPTLSSNGLPSREELTIAWGDQVLPKLGGLTKAMYAAGRFTDTSGAKATFAVPNAVHREKSLQKLPEVEAALAAHFGRPVPLELVVEGEQASPKSAPRSGASAPATPRDDAESSAHEASASPSAPAPLGEVDEIDEIGDPSELIDAPADDRTTVDRVIEAFPGAEVVDP